MRFSDIHRSVPALWLATYRAASERPEWRVLAVGTLCGALLAQHVVGTQQEAGAPTTRTNATISAHGASGNSAPLYLDPPPVAGAPAGPALTEHADSAKPRPRAKQPVVPEAVQGIPSTVLAAYRRAADSSQESKPSCHLSLPLLAAIGRVESGHARGGDLDDTGTTRTPILGPQLNGGRFAAIRDTDRGVYDGDTVWDRAVGPMQFIPSTWRSWASDGNSDGATNPHNVFDATVAASRYLCAAGGDLSTERGLRRAVLAYNRSEHYLQVVLSWMRVYAGGTEAVPDSSGDQKAAEPKRSSSNKSAKSGADSPPRRANEPQSSPPAYSARSGKPAASSPPPPPAPQPPRSEPDDEPQKPSPLPSQLEPPPVLPTEDPPVEPEKLVVSS